MDYIFPEIKNINDVLFAIEGSDEFIVAKKDGYTVLNYVVSMTDTFPSTKPAGGSAKDRAKKAAIAALRRECRGMIFCSETGDILRRPFHKFFNVGERADHLPDTFDLSKPHVILEKLDGSMIVPFMLNGEIRFGTKMGLTDVALPAEEFVAANPKYAEIAAACLERDMSPIFEWCTRKQRIVLDYGSEDQLILTAVRYLDNGDYLPYHQMAQLADFYDVPVVKAFEPATDMDEFLLYTKALKDVEGFVIRFADGHMAKVKCDWYCQIHKAKDALTQDRNIVEMILDCNIDDLKPHLPVEDRERLEVFEKEIVNRIDEVACSINDTVRTLHAKKIDRKTFAMEMAGNIDPLTRSAIFTLFDDPRGAREVVVKTIRNKLTKNVNYDILKTGWLKGINFND
jgi:T4 RnlA family RNA ligase